jgi:hypothetical protein
MDIGPREIVTPFRPIPLEVPEGMKPNEFFNSTENLNDLVHNNGLLVNPENLLLYRKALGHSSELDCSIIYNTSQIILNPLGRPVRRTQVPQDVKRVWNRMNQVIIDAMLEQYPDPAEALVLAGEASLDATWPLTSPGVPSIRMLHNHFIVFPMEQLRSAGEADPANPNLTDGGQHSLFQAYMRDVYRRFLHEALELEILEAVPTSVSRLGLTGYPEGLPCWEIGAEPAPFPTSACGVSTTPSWRASSTSTGPSSPRSPVATPRRLPISISRSRSSGCSCSTTTS